MGLLKTRSPVLSLDLGANFLFESSRADGAADVVVAVLMSPASSQSFMATGAAIWKTVASGVGPVDPFCRGEKTRWSQQTFLFILTLVNTTMGVWLNWLKYHHINMIYENMKTYNIHYIHTVYRFIDLYIYIHDI